MISPTSLRSRGYGYIEIENQEADPLEMRSQAELRNKETIQIKLLQLQPQVQPQLQPQDKR